MLTLFVIGVALALTARAFPRRGQQPSPNPPPESRSEAVRRVLKHLERKTIAELAEGEAAVIVGTVIGETMMEAPMSNASCIGYHLRIHQQLIDSRRELHDEARCGPFVLRDATGEIAVDVRGLELAITAVRSILFAPPHPPEIRMLCPPVPVLVEEGVLQPGMRVLVCGVVTRELTATDYRDGRPHMTLRASTTFPLVASTDEDLFAESNRPIAPVELHRR